MSSEMNFAFTAQDFKPLEFSPVKWGGPAVTSMSIGEEGDAITVDEKPAVPDQKILSAATPLQITTTPAEKAAELPPADHKVERPVVSEPEHMTTHAVGEEGDLPIMSTMAGGEEGDPIELPDLIVTPPAVCITKGDLLNLSPEVGPYITSLAGGEEGDLISVEDIQTDVSPLYADDEVLFVAPAFKETGVQTNITLETVIAGHDSFAELIDNTFPAAASQISESVAATGRDLTAHFALEANDLPVMDQFNALV